MAHELANPDAICVKTGKLIRPRNADKSLGPFECRECKEELIFRRESVNGHRQHFAHKAKSSCGGGGNGPSEQHTRAMDIIVDSLGAFSFVQLCITCSTRQPGSLLTFSDADFFGKKEVSISDNKYRLDVGVFERKSGQLHAAIEVHYTHPMGQDKVNDTLKLFSGRVYEVEAESILEAWDGEEDFTRPFESKSLVECNRCVTKRIAHKKQKAEERLRERQAAEAAKKQQAVQEEINRQWREEEAARQQISDEESKREREERERKWKITAELNRRQWEEQQARDKEQQERDAQEAKLRWEEWHKAHWKDETEKEQLGAKMLARVHENLANVQPAKMCAGCPQRAILTAQKDILYWINYIDWSKEDLDRMASAQKPCIVKFRGWMYCDACRTSDEKMHD